MAAEEAFLKFRRTGCADALGLVFDATAPHLLLVAARLAPAGVSPDDLLQQTFVIAIEKANSYDERQPLSRWLAGILAKHALAERRRSRRVLDVDRLSAPQLASPADEVEMLEQVEAIQATVAGMPSDYRSVLRLHLLHGLTVSEIAQALERSFRTTQSQLRRGLELLRRALPAGIGLAITAQATGLAPIRTAVLKAASAKGSTAGAVVGTSGLLARWLAAGMLVSVLVGGVAAMVSSTWTASVPPGDSTESVESADTLASNPVANDRLWASNAKSALLRTPLIGQRNVERRDHRERPAVAQDESSGPTSARDRSVLELAVVDEASGNPIEKFSIVCFRVIREQRGLIRGNRTARYAGVHRGGIQRIDDLHRGENMLLVLPEVGSGYVPSGYLSVQLRGPTHELTVRLRRPISVPVRVIDGAGRLVVGTRVQLLHRLEKDADARHVQRLRRGDFGASHWSGYVELGSATTNEDGIAQVPWQRWDRPCRLRATGPGHITTEVDGPSIREAMATFTLRVVRGATLRGTAVPMARIMEFAVDNRGKPIPVAHALLNPHIVLRDASTGVLHTGRDGKGYSIAPDGKFLWDGLPAGRWQLLFRFCRPDSPRSRSRTLQRMPQVLAEVTLGSSSHERVDVDLAPLLPTAVHGRVFLHGVEVQPDGLGYLASWPDETGKEVSFRGFFLPSGFGRAGGGYRMRGLLPGHHVFMLSARGADGRKRVFHTFEPVRLIAAQDRALDLHFQHRVARIRLVGPDRITPIAGRVVRVGDAHRDTLVTDADGWITVDPVRLLTMRVAVYASGLDLEAVRKLRYDEPRRRRTVIGEVHVDNKRKVSVHTLVVPERAPRQEGR